MTEDGLKKFEKYLELKSEFNTRPDKSVVNLSVEDVYHLLRDFLRDLAEPFLPQSDTNSSFVRRFRSVEDRRFIMCSDIEAIRQKSPIGYQMLKEIVEFASKWGINGKQIAELISRPPKLTVSEEAAQYLIKNKVRIFSEPSTAEAVDDDNRPRCRPSSGKVHLRMTLDANEEIRET